MIEGDRVASAADVGTLVRETRLAAAMTQQQLADLVGTTRQWVIRLERGYHSSAMSTVLVALSVLGLEMVAQYDLPPRGPRRAYRAEDQRTASMPSATPSAP